MNGNFNLGTRFLSSLVIINSSHEKSKSCPVLFCSDDYTEYGDATKYKRFEEVDRYFIFVNGNFRETALNKKSLQDVLADKWTPVSEYVTKYKVDVKTENGWKLAVGYYNTL